MLYSNPEYFIFLSIVLMLYTVIGKNQNSKLLILIGSSLFFYIWSGFLNGLVFIFILVVSWGAVYLSSLAADKRLRQLMLGGGIIIMTAHLFFWKYMPWAISLGQHASPDFFGGVKINLPLPVGISFFTLQGIAYLVDYGRNDAKFVAFKDFVLFKSFFPQLVAGPITRMGQIGHQLQNLQPINFENFRTGLFLFSIGFFKKVAIADRMAVIADPVFSSPSSYTAGSICLAVLAYTVQIWGDFSGYTDMGRGCAKMFGVNLPENFLSPYLSRSPSEFWRRWHITLSQWIRDYIYIPLGGADGGIIRAAMIVTLTMALSGLWHGAAFTFLLWGIYHGALLVFERIAKRLQIPIFTGKTSIFFTFILIMFGWLIFRSESINELRNVLLIVSGAMPAGHLTVSKYSIIIGVVTCFLFHILTYSGLEDVNNKIPNKLLNKFNYKILNFASKSILMSFSIAFFFSAALYFRAGNTSEKFIYFQF